METGLRQSETLPRLSRTGTVGQPSVAHIGVGAFHRCHQAEYLDDLRLAGHAGCWEVGVNLMPPPITPVLGPQGGIYSRTLRDGGRADTRVIGCIAGVMDAWPDPAAAIRRLADPAITSITMTVTEKGYCHLPAFGTLDETHAGIVADLTGRPPRTLPGFLLAVLVARAAAGAGPVNLISCDNIAGNGAVLAAVLGRMAALARPDLAGWVADNVAFPSTMVDRIVPATTEDDRDAVAGVLGAQDAGAVVGEPFRQWAIENRFAAPRPPWEAVGVEFPTDVTGHEQVKMRVLNAAQTMLALGGALHGHTFTSGAVQDRQLAAVVEAVLRDETLPHLPVVAGMASAAYLAQSLDRIRNTAIRHRCHQIATDTSQKIRQRLLDPIRARRAAGLAAPGLTAAVGWWVAYLARSGRAFGAGWTVSDPVMARVGDVLASAGGDVDRVTQGVLGLADVFGRDLSADVTFGRGVAAAARAMLQQQATALQVSPGS
jgi:fructuronate reductase